MFSKEVKLAVKWLVDRENQRIAIDIEKLRNHIATRQLWNHEYPDTFNEERIKLYKKEIESLRKQLKGDYSNSEKSLHNTEGNNENR